MPKTNSRQSSKPAAPRKRAGAFAVSSEPMVGEKAEEDAHKFEVSSEPSSSPAYEELGALPSSYGHTDLFLIARDPRWLFTYWDVDWSAFPGSKMRGGDRKVFLKIRESNGTEESTIEVNPDARNWYVPVKKASTEYVAELGYYNRDGDWTGIVTSASATTPSDSLSEDANAQFATVPFHITFQRLLEMVRTRMAEGETLIQALARLQGEGSRLALGQAIVPELSEEQRRVLATLVGEEAVSRISMGSGEIDQLIRKALLEKLQSESASELVSKGRLAELLSTESSLFSALGSSWGPEVSSLFSAMGVSQAEVTSLFSALGEWQSKELSSLSSAFAGWGANVTSLSSAMSAWSPEVSSLFSAMGIFGPETSSLFSGIGASWSAQPFSQERGFYLHVNAEVIFYGGTHPDATLWIDGKQVQMQPDGTFHYHFKFPDGNYEIPIVAKSPDGLEERSASLVFTRATARVGDVGHTSQPAGLTPPLGGKN
jgi:hypothetical protein